MNDETKMTRVDQRPANHANYCSVGFFCVYSRDSWANPFLFSY